MDLKQYQVVKSPPTVYYIPDFITPHEESVVLSMITKTPKPRWTQLSHRRLINYGGVPHPKGMIAEEIPAWLRTFVNRVNDLTEVFEEGKKANHVLVNEYLAGQGIMPHLDGPLFYPTITTISCGSHTVLEFHEPHEQNSETRQRTVTKLLIRPRSLLIIKDDMYHKYLHSIAEIKEDTIDESVANLPNLAKENTAVKIDEQLVRENRISLTIRHVPKTSKLKIKLS
ncbi:alpha-ketoglutarate-dependent dioxygenase alkB homolog 6 [Sabethes cyaneus]|uniref:alpha-ketoglutarate-dependent dioxygenase alkB homolog 6 n=1 Tax=Sabethes cyaneus TaxID=53552 RepID=UPI00237ECFC3|nr:alpha-ketoglutarate-dependent dioxygenase alkB homolog 6 [Sabethes cyaneus]